MLLSLEITNQINNYQSVEFILIYVAHVIIALTDKNKNPK